MDYGQNSCVISLTTDFQDAILYIMRHMHNKCDVISDLSLFIVITRN